MKLSEVVTPTENTIAKRMTYYPSLVLVAIASTGSPPQGRVVSHFFCKRRNKNESQF